MMELSWNPTTLSWKFEHTKIFAKHFYEQFRLLHGVMIENLDEYFNIDVANGDWLTKIGNLLALDRPFGADGTQFVWDIDKWDDPNVFWDGMIGNIIDPLFRVLIRLKENSKKKLFTMKNIAENLYTVFGKDRISIRFMENIDRLGNEKPMYFRILIDFKYSEDAKIFVGLLDVMPNALIGKPMGVFYEVDCTYSPDEVQNAA